MNIGSSDKPGGVEAVNSIFREVLSVTWYAERDYFVFCFESVIKVAYILPYTKRNIFKNKHHF